MRWAGKMRETVPGNIIREVPGETGEVRKGSDRKRLFFPVQFVKAELVD